MAFKVVGGTMNFNIVPNEVEIRFSSDETQPEIALPAGLASDLIDAIQRSISTRITSTEPFERKKP